MTPIHPVVSEPKSTEIQHSVPVPVEPTTPGILSGVRGSFGPTSQGAAGLLESGGGYRIQPHGLAEWPRDYAAQMNYDASMPTNTPIMEHKDRFKTKTEHMSGDVNPHSQSTGIRGDDSRYRSKRPRWNLDDPVVRDLLKRENLRKKRETDENIRQAIILEKHAQYSTGWSTPMDKRIRNNLEKYAADPAEAGDLSFEQALSNLAHSYLREKAPGLLDYEIGFQLVDKNEDNTKALGLFGFKVGGQWLYAPVIFDNGSLKGHELLYMKNKDLFVPMKENWLNNILNRRPHVMGKGVTKDLGRLGVLPPNFYQLTRSPAKYASDVTSDWTMGFLPSFARAVTKSPLNSDRIPNLEDFLKEAGVEACLGLVRMLEDYPALMDGIDEFHGRDKIANIMQEVGLKDKLSRGVLNKDLPIIANQTNTASKTILPSSTLATDEPGDLAAGAPGDLAKSSGIRVIHIRKMAIRGYGPVDEDDAVAKHDIKPGESEKLQRGEVVIRDWREETEISRPYTVETRQFLFNPGESGLYDILVRPGEFAKCAVFLSPYTSTCRKSTAVVARVEGGTWLHSHITDMWAKSQYTKEEFKDWLASLPDAEDGIKEGGDCLIISPTGSQATVPLSVSHRDMGDDTPVYEVYYRDHAMKKRPFSLIEHPYKGNLDAASPLVRQYPHEIEPLAWNKDKYGAQHIMFTRKPGRGFRSTGDCLYVPAKSKCFKLDQRSCGCGHDSEPPPILSLGNLPDLYMGLIKSGELAEMTIQHDGYKVAINTGKWQDADSALVELVAEHGFREDPARELIDTAKLKKKASCWVKYADPYFDLQRSGPSAPAISEPPYGFDPMTNSQMPTYTRYEQDVPVPDLQARLQDRSVYHPTYGSDGPENYRVGPEPDQEAAQMAMQASQTGQKEVFDTSVIGGLLKATKSETVVNKYRGKLMGALDALGRLILSISWNKEDFDDRYGKEDADAIEDALKTTFSDMGDLVLSLQQGDPRNVSGEDATHPDLDRVSE